MKIGIYVPELILDEKGGGAHSFQKNILNALMSNQTRHDFYFFYNEGQPDKSVSHNMYVKVFYKKKHDKKKNRIKKLLNKLFNNNNDHFVTLQEELDNNKIDLIWFLTPVASEVKIPFVYTVWDLQHRLQPFFPEVSTTGWLWDDREKTYNNFLPKASYVIAGTEQGKNEIKRFYGIDDERIRVIPLPTPSFNLYYQNQNSTYLIDDKVSFIFYPAQFWPHKNHVVLLYALKLLMVKYNIKFKLIFTGSDKGNLNYIKRKIEELDLVNDVIILGFVSFEEMICLYKTAFAIVFPTFFGPDNIPPLEAFNLGCPVIASNIPGAKEQLGDAALLVDPKDENEIASAVKMLVENPVLRKELIDKGKTRASSWTSVDYVNKMIEIIEEFEKFRRCWSNTEKYIHPQYVYINISSIKF